MVICVRINTSLFAHGLCTCPIKYSYFKIKLEEPSLIKQKNKDFLILCALMLIFGIRMRTPMILPPKGGRKRQKSYEIDFNLPLLTARMSFVAGGQRELAFIYCPAITSLYF